jgi:hypothetical protein
MVSGKFATLDADVKVSGTAVTSWSYVSSDLSRVFRVPAGVDFVASEPFSRLRCPDQVACHSIVAQ